MDVSLSWGMIVDCLKSLKTSQQKAESKLQTQG